jgi:hypothetical protein
LLGAAALVVAGCGPPEEPEIVASDVLGDQLRVAQAALAAYEGLDDVTTERAFALARVERLTAAGATATPPPAAPAGLQPALAAEGEALRAHVEAIGLLGEREWRELFGELIAGGARNEASLRTKLDRRPLETAFPGQSAS